jgi:hypothetical protein
VRDRSWHGLAIVVALSGADPKSLPAQVGVVAGQVLAEAPEQPIVRAQIQLRPLERHALSDSAGRFRIRDVPPGEYVIVIRAIGFDSLVAKIRLVPGDVVEVDVLLRRSTQALAPVTVTESASPNRIRLAEFEERRSLGFGRFLDHSVFERSAGSQLDAVLIGRIPGLRTKRLYGKVTLESQRDGRSCYPQIVVNGISMYNGATTSAGRIAVEMATFDLTSVRVDEVIGFEWHTPSTTPARFNATGSGGHGSPCGTAIFWTK